MGEIKSAFEKAMERVEKIGEASEEEVMKWKYVPEGQNLATKYLQEECSLGIELDKYGDKAKPFITQGAEKVFFSNIGLPVNDFANKNNKRAMEGIKELKKDKTGVENVYSKIRRIFSHYEKEGEQQRKQAYERLKQDFQMKIQQAMRQQGGLPPGARIDVERQPQFQEEWRRISAQLDSQYHKLLGEYKQEIINLP
jgi:plasmid stabilization system protein ParE